jgi:hypothetical protein
MKISLKQSLGVGLGLALLLGMASTAKAADQYYRLVDTSLASGLTVYYRNSTGDAFTSSNVSTGPYTLKIRNNNPSNAVWNATPSQYAFCVDIYTTVNINQSVKFTPTLAVNSMGDDLPNPPPMLGGTAAAKQAAYLAYLFLPSLPGSYTTTERQAMGVAMWEIASDGDITTNNLTLLKNRLNRTNAAAGLFGINTGSVLDKAAEYLQMAYNNYLVDTTYQTKVGYTFNTIGVGDGQRKQHFLYIPEPAFYQMAALLGLGGLSLILRRRRAQMMD